MVRHTSVYIQTILLIKIFKNGRDDPQAEKIMKLLINSALGYDIGLRHLLSSMQKCDNRIQNKDIIIVKAGGHRYSTELLEDITIITADNNSFDFTALIAINDLDIQAEGFLYIHDTCVLGSQFFNKAYDKGFHYQMVPLYGGASMNIGYYSKTCLKIHEDLLLAFKNQDYTQQGLQQAKAAAVRSEDIISRKYKTDGTIYQTHCPEITGPTDYYNTGTQRMTEHYTGLDLYKIKANHDKPLEWPNWIIKL